MKALSIQSGGAFDLVAASLQDEATAWSFGTFGAGIEIRRQPGQPVRVSRTDAGCAIITPVGAASWRDMGALHAVAFETAIGHGSSWGQGIALCVPEDGCETGRRTRLTEIGPDDEALRAPDRDAMLFDLGLGARQVDICVRTADPTLVTALRAMCGCMLLEAGDDAFLQRILAMPLDLVIRYPFGRAECPVGPGAGAARGHVLPRWMRLRRSHAATTPIPHGWLPCAHIFPAHPLSLGSHGEVTMDMARHDRFQAALVRFGDAEHVKIKANYFASFASGSAFSFPETSLPRRFALAAARVAERQAHVLARCAEGR